MPLDILVTAQQRGFLEALIPPIKELERRGHRLHSYTTGTTEEARAFQDLQPFHINPSPKDYEEILKGHDILLTGMSGQGTPDAYFVQAANALNIPSVAVNMQNTNYLGKLGEREENFPTIIALMDEQSIETMRRQIPGSAGIEAVARSRVAGWTIFDHYASTRDSYTSKKKTQLLNQLKQQGIKLDEQIHVYFTQHLPTPNDDSWVPYEKCVSEALCTIAQDNNIKLVVKPHPREDPLFVQELTQQYGFTFIPASACKTSDLILAADAVVAGRSTCLNEACLLDRNTAGILPGIDDLTPYNAALVGAIPYTTSLSGIGPVLFTVTAKDPKTNIELNHMRRKFSVDGKASQRLANIIEQLKG